MTEFACKHTLIVLMPVFEDRASARKLIQGLVKHQKVSPFIVAVEDGSISDIMDASDISSAGLEGEILHLTRNVGHQRAIALGVMHIALNYKGYTLVVMDSDGEDTPEAMPELVEALRSGGSDLVVAQRQRRSEGWQFRTFYMAYRFVFHLLTGRTIRFGNFMALSERATRRLAVMPETWLHFPASVILSKLRQGALPIDRGNRYFGVSRMNLVSLMLHGMRSIMVFSDDVLVRMGLFCAALVVVCLGMLGVTVILKITDHATPGWFTASSGLLAVLLTQAGILSFITLMISGTIKASGSIQRADLDLLIDRVEEASTSVDPAVLG